MNIIQRVGACVLVSLFLGGCSPASSSLDFTQVERADDSLSSMDWDAIADRCAPPQDAEPVLYSNDYRWGYTTDELLQRYEELYQSDKRLFARARYNAVEQRFELPYTDFWGGAVVMPRRIVENVRMHIEKALRRGYVQAIIFPDMGHSHFFLPEEYFEANYTGYPVTEFSRRMEAMLDDPELRVLYHTAEQLSTLDDAGMVKQDPQIQWRYYTRNIVGDNRYGDTMDLLRDIESGANTARDLEGHRYHGAGFSVSANKDGCFPFEYQGQTYFFDLSLHDAPQDPSTPPSDF